MAGKRWSRTFLICLLCIWPLYSILSAVYYHWWRESLDERELFKREYQKYLRDETGINSQQEAVVDFEEFPFMRGMYVHAFPVRRQEFLETLTNDVMNRLNSHVNSQEDYALVMDLLRPLVNCPSMMKIGTQQSGRWTCGLDTFLARKSLCYVYSFNWNVTNLSFEFEVLQRMNCIVHVFDPFLNQEHKEQMVHLHPKLVFHDYTLGPMPDMRYLFDELETDIRSVEEQNFQEIMTNMEHQWVDIIKLDYNGEEANKLIELVGYWRRRQHVTRQPLSLPVGQMLFTLQSGGAAIKTVQSTIALMNLGFAIYHTELDLRTQRPWENVAFSFINMRDPQTFLANENSNL